ncbi:MAG TPA: hypothetical protein VD995_04610 [Azospirillum sp.]|nr:hypothetical protein [Azospirillum sp.]
MTAHTRAKIRDAEVPDLGVGITPVIHTVAISATTASGGIAASDTVECFDLPKGVRLVDASIRVSGDVSATTGTATVQLQAKQDSTTINLTDALNADAAGSKRMNIAPPAVNTDHVTTVQFTVATAALDTTASGTVEVMVQYQAP